MKIAMGADSYGFEAKEALVTYLQGQGHEVVDAGCVSAVPDGNILDYADAVARAVSGGKAERGILLCKSGGAMGIRANRWPGVRAVLGFDAACVEHDREASDVNVMCLPAAYLDSEVLQGLVDVFVTARFEALPRRIERLAALERATVTGGLTS